MVVAFALSLTVAAEQGLQFSGLWFPLSFNWIDRWSDCFLRNLVTVGSICAWLSQLKKRVARHGTRYRRGMDRQRAGGAFAEK